MDQPVRDKVGKRMLTVPEAAEFLGISPRTIYNRIHRHSKNPFEIKAKRIGRLVRFDIQEIERWLSHE